MRQKESGMDDTQSHVDSMSVDELKEELITSFERIKSLTRALNTRKISVYELYRFIHHDVIYQHALFDDDYNHVCIKLSDIEKATGFEYSEKIESFVGRAIEPEELKTWKD